jgi:hypothetical protein
MRDSSGPPEKPRADRRTGRWRRELLSIPPVILLLTSLVLAFPRTPRVQFLPPPAEVCLGSDFQVGVRDRSGDRARFHLAVTDPSGASVWTKIGKAARTWQKWPVRPGSVGTYTVTYRASRNVRRFRSDVLACGEGSGGLGTASLTLTDDDDGVAMFSMYNASPGDSENACIVISLGGTETAGIRLYGSTGGTSLDAHLDLTVTRGTIATPDFDSCEGFVPDPVDYAGAGPGVIYRDSLRDYPDDFETGVVDPSPLAPESWTPSESHAYRFTVTVAENAPGGLVATQTFAWEARSA